MIDKADPLPITRQVQLLDLARSSVYYQPAPTSAADLALMAAMDEIISSFPSTGSEGSGASFATGAFRWVELTWPASCARWASRRFIPSAGSPSLIPGTGSIPTSCAAGRSRRLGRCGAPTSPYLPMARGFCYLVAIMDWASRRVLAFRLSNTLDASFCIEALQEALERYEAPDIFNTDRGRSSPARASPVSSRPAASRSAWTGGAAGWTTSSSSDCGGASNTRRCT